MGGLSSTAWLSEHLLCECPTDCYCKAVSRRLGSVTEDSHQQFTNSNTSVVREEEEERDRARERKRERWRERERQAVRKRRAKREKGSPQIILIKRQGSSEVDLPLAPAPRGDNSLIGGKGSLSVAVCTLRSLPGQPRQCANYCQLLACG